MSLDYVKKTYHPDRPETRLITTYGSMSEWIRSPAAARARRPAMPAGLLAQNNPSPKFTSKLYKRGKQEYIYMRRARTAAPAVFHARGDALNETLPVHVRYTTNCGYDDFHKAYRAAKVIGPREDFPVWGPPRLRHGRQGGSWRHLKEVLQAGGSRIVFIDGQVSTGDTMQTDGVRGGHLILADAKRSEVYHDLDQDRPFSKTTPRLYPQAQRRDLYLPLTAKYGLEKNNWNIIR